MGVTVGLGWKVEGCETLGGCVGVTVGLGCMVEGCETLSIWEAMGTGITGGGGGPWPKVGQKNCGGVKKGKGG